MFLKAIKQGPLADIRQSGIFVALGVIIALFTILTKGALLSPQNVSNIVTQNSYVLILAIGMVMVIIAGHIDLSVGSVVALTGAVAGVVIVRWELPWIFGILVAIVVGALVGAWQGFWVAYVGIPAFIVTLAGMLAFRGLTMIVVGNTNISPFPPEFTGIASGFINGLLGGDGFDAMTVFLGAFLVAAYALSVWRKRTASAEYGQEVEAPGWAILRVALMGVLTMFFAWRLAHYKGLPVVLLVLGVLVIIYSIVTTKTPFGRASYAIGGNLAAARLSGIKVKRVTFWLFVNMGVLAAIAGIVYAARLNIAGPKAGVMLELDAIAACFIGGAAVSGGVGRVVGAIVGGLIMGIMNNGMSLMGIGIDYQQAIKGLVLLAAVAFDVWNKKRGGVAAT